MQFHERVNFYFHWTIIDKLLWFITSCFRLLSAYIEPNYMHGNSYKLESLESFSQYKFLSFVAFDQVFLLRLHAMCIDIHSCQSINQFWKLFFRCKFLSRIHDNGLLDIFFVKNKISLLRFEHVMWPWPSYTCLRSREITSSSSSDPNAIDSIIVKLTYI